MIIRNKMIRTANSPRKQEDIVCVFRDIAATQREHELSRGEDLQGTKHYELAGCYSCDGKTKLCSSAYFISATA